MPARKAGSVTTTAAEGATTAAVTVIDTNPTTVDEVVTTAVAAATASNPTTAVGDAMTAEAVETTSVPKDMEGMDSGLVTGFVRSAAT